MTTRSFGYGLEVEEILIASIHRLSVREWPTHSNQQADATNAEKLEDNISVLLSYANEARMADDTRKSLLAEQPAQPAYPVHWAVGPSHLTLLTPW